MLPRRSLRGRAPAGRPGQDSESNRHTGSTARRIKGLWHEELVPQALSHPFASGESDPGPVDPRREAGLGCRHDGFARRPHRRQSRDARAPRARRPAALPPGRDVALARAPGLGGDRGGQGTPGPHAPPGRPALPRSVRRRELRRDPRDAPGGRAVRLRPRGLHGCAARQARSLSGGHWRTALPRRDRGAPARAPSQAPEDARRAAGPPPREHTPGAVRRRDRERDGGGSQPPGRRGPLPGGPLSPAFGRHSPRPPAPGA